jgi:DNA-binding NarL/FixJ family response regulator
MSKPRVLLADDHQMVAEGLRNVLEPEFELVGIVADGRELLAAATKLQPDVIVMDITMPSLNGIEAARQLRQAASRAKVVVLTMHRDAAYAARALDAGAAGFVLKHSAASELITAIREALQGRIYVTPLIAGELLQSYRQKDRQPEEPFDQLTPRQREVLQLIAEGQSAKAVAKTLHISPRTAEFHKARILRVLGLNTAAELVQYAIRHGLTPG